MNRSDLSVRAHGLHFLDIFFSENVGTGFYLTFRGEFGHIIDSRGQLTCIRARGVGQPRGVPDCFGGGIWEKGKNEKLLLWIKYRF